MRSLLLSILLGALAGAASAQEKVAQTFNGISTLTTPSFQVQDEWEVRWDSSDALAITVFSKDGMIVESASGSPKGSLFHLKGGTFSLQINSAGSGTTPWHVSVVEIGSDMASAASTNAAPNPVPPQTASAPASTNSTNTASATPPTNAPATNAAPAPVGGHLTEDQAHAVVLIKGDYMEGTGFLVKTLDGPTVVTNLHVISANPNLRIYTTTGAQIKTLTLKAAVDRDLAMIAIQDDHYTYLDLATNIRDTVQTDDEVITPGNSEGGEVMLNTKGKVLGIGPERIEIDNPIYHGNSGGPVFHTQSGKVIAIVTQAMKVNTSNELDKTSFENKNSAITSSMRYFGLRLDTVPHWEPCDWNRFLNETTFLKDFHEQSRSLDSFLNGTRYENAHVAGTDENSYPNSQYFLRNEKIVAARDSYHKFAADADNSQKLDALRELVMNLETIADADMTAIQNPNTFYSYNQIRADLEIKYRKYLRTQIEKEEGLVNDMGH